MTKSKSLYIYRNVVFHISSAIDLSFQRVEIKELPGGHIIKGY